MSERNSQDPLLECNLSTEQIIQGIVNGDRNVARFIYYDRRSYKKIFYLFRNSGWVKLPFFKNGALLRGLSQMDSEDCYQDTHLQFRTKALKGELKENDWRAYLFTLAKGVKWSFCRKGKGKQWNELDSVENMLVDPVNENDFAAGRGDDLRRQSMALGPVGETGYEIIELIVSERLQSNEQVADALDIEPNTVSRRFADYRARMKKQYDIELPDLRNFYNINR